ncbi:MAG: alpha-galactosidase [Mangrovicoccus sp.]
MNKSEQSIPVTIAYIGGGSLNWAPKLMADLAQDQRLSADIRLYDLDLAAAQRNLALGEAFAKVSTGTPPCYKAVASLAEALSGADLVIVSILPGRFEDMAQDIGIPARYGIPQAVGDTVGPGGFVRAMRAIPMLYEIGQAIAAYAPTAYVCNLTNPMSVLTGALFRAFPGIKAWGECHEVTKLRKQVAWIANREAGEPLWTHRDVQVSVTGINHFTFVNQISLAGRDMLPAYAAFAEEFREKGWIEIEPAPADEHERYFSDRSRVKFDLYRRFGIPGAAGDRHLVEFLPASEYLHDPAAWDFGLTPVEYRRRYQEEKRQAAMDLIEGRRPPQPERSDEALVDQIAALLSGAPYISNVNLPNQGQMPDLPQGAIVETNALFSGLGITPMTTQPLPPALAEIIQDHSARQTALLDAVIQETPAALFPLFKRDPLVAPLPEPQARALFAEMIEATRAWIPDTLTKGAA